jgi:peptidyl-Lys metalloendopeptidase
MKRFVQRLLVLAFLFASAVHASGKLQIVLAVPAAQQDKEVGKIVFSMQNVGDQPISVLKWKTPFVEAGGRLASNIFVVSDSAGKPVSYIGRNVKFVNMNADSFIELRPGQSITKTIDIAQDYAMSDGSYSVAYTQDPSTLVAASPSAAASTMRAAASGTVRDAITSNTLKLWVNSRLIQKPTTSAQHLALPIAKSALLGNDECGQDLLDQIPPALAAAQSMASEGFDYEYNHWDNEWIPDPVKEWVSTWRPSDRFKYWLGDDGVIDGVEEDAAVNGDALTTHTEAPMQMFANQLKASSGQVNLVCSICDGWDANTAAHAETSTSYLIYVCPAFFSRPITGTDSMAGIIMHEISHFPFALAGVTHVPATADYVYGQSGAHQLAGSNIGQARLNADNWEYFYENPTGLQ